MLPCPGCVCGARPLLSLGALGGRRRIFGLRFGSLFAGPYRIHRVFARHNRVDALFHLELCELLQVLGLYSSFSINSLGEQITGHSYSDDLHTSIIPYLKSGFAI